MQLYVAECPGLYMYSAEMNVCISVVKFMYMYLKSPRGGVNR